jgi:hypothetical protein
VDIRTAPDLLKRPPVSPESRFLLGNRLACLSFDIVGW